MIPPPSPGARERAELQQGGRLVKHKGVLLRVDAICLEYGVFVGQDGHLIKPTKPVCPKWCVYECFGLARRLDSTNDARPETCYEIATWSYAIRRLLLCRLTLLVSAIFSRSHEMIYFARCNVDVEDQLVSQGCHMQAHSGLLVVIG